MNIRKHIPDSITSMNLLCGVMGVILTMEGRPDLGFLMMICGAVFDFFDGLSARLLKASSGIGKELDSLADVVSFGVLPSLMLFKACGSMPMKYITLLIAVFSALRLAKFNLDERQHEGFLGLPTPASAMVCGSLAYYVHIAPGSFLASCCAGPVFLPVLAIILCALLVSEIPMFSMKFGGGIKSSRADSVARIVFLAVCVLALLTVALTGFSWSLAVLAAFTGYILINLVLAIIKR
ncbi:MAG: CDP-diacylglycerol--serine O-phosphatidyltransferase [Bacteroidales bacterium]|nr:CDP-diacylglycerol--serine O-phosphatidyltransferase [Bacteroidales bacterium]